MKTICEFTTQTFELGGAARGTAGNDSAGVGNQVSSPRTIDTQVFSDRTGLYGGAFVKNGIIEPDDKANFIYYGQALTVHQILSDNQVRATPAANGLAAMLSHSQPPSP